MVDQVDSGRGPKGGWPARAHEEVAGLRPAITAQLDEPMVASSMAPMMGELLTRLEGFSRPGDVADLQPPSPPTERAPITQGEAVSTLREACHGLRQQVNSGAVDPKSASALKSMVNVIENHLSMKGEIIARATSDTSPA